MPTDWVIRVIEGPDQGQQTALAPGPNLIGRGKAAALKLSPEDVSWEHAVVTRDGEDCFLENLSAQGTWVGDARVNGRVKLRAGDKLRLTEETVLRVESPTGAGGKRGVLLFALLLMVATLAAVVYFQLGGGASTDHFNWDAAYHAVDPWLRRQADADRLPPEAPLLFEQARRLTIAKDWVHAKALWVRLQIVLASSSARIHCFQLAEADQKPKQPRNPSLLAAAGRSSDTMTNDEMGAAAGEFVQRQLAFVIEQERLGASSLLSSSP